MLFYDGLKEENNDLDVMQELSRALLHSNSSSNNTRVQFATLDIRQHPHYRSVYKYANDPDPFLYQFYTNFPEDTDTDNGNLLPLSISSRTFMNLQGDIYWPHRVLLFASDFHVYAEMDLDFNANVPAKVGILQHWIENVVYKDPEQMEIIMQSPTEKERIQAKKKTAGQFLYLSPILCQISTAFATHGKLKRIY